MLKENTLLVTKRKVPRKTLGLEKGRMVDDRRVGQNAKIKELVAGPTIGATKL